MLPGWCAHLVWLPRLRVVATSVLTNNRIWFLWWDTFITRQVYLVTWIQSVTEVIGDDVQMLAWYAVVSFWVGKHPMNGKWKWSSLVTRLRMPDRETKPYEIIVHTYNPLTTHVVGTHTASFEYFISVQWFDIVVWTQEAKECYSALSTFPISASVHNIPMAC